MTQGLLKKLALAAPFVVCLPFCAFGADGPAADSDDNPKIFEEFSLTAATVERRPRCPTRRPRLPPRRDRAWLRSTVTAAAAARVRPRCCQNNCYNSCCGDPCGSSCQHQTGMLDTCSGGLHNFFSCGDNCCPQFFTGVEATLFWANVHGMHADAAVENTNHRQYRGTLERRRLRPVHVLAADLGRRSGRLLGRPRPVLVFERFVRRSRSGLPTAGPDRRHLRRRPAQGLHG